MGANHTINHREPLKPQIDALNLSLPLKYIFIAHSTDMYTPTRAEICVPFGKVCSIVQGEARMYGYPYMAKSLSFIWELLGTKPSYGVDVGSHGKILEELRILMEKGKIKYYLKTRLRLDLEGLKRGHELIETGGNMGKVALGADEGKTRGI